MGAAWLVTGPVLDARVRLRRVPLRGPRRVRGSSGRLSARRKLSVSSNHGTGIGA